jgi:microcystin-dependent protein
MPTGSVIAFAGSTAPTNWLLCHGQAISRSTYSSLFTAIGTTYGAGDGSTTFALPDMRGRVAAGKDDMGGSAASRLTSTVLSASNTLGATGGSQTHTLTSGESGVPAHSHANTLTNNAVNTGNNSVGHTHSGTTNNDSPDHTHQQKQQDSPSYSWSVSGGGASWGLSGTEATSGASARHTHSFTTGGISANHTHSVTSNVTISNVNNSAANAAAAHTNTQPTIVLNYIIKI